MELERSGSDWVSWELMKEELVIIEFHDFKMQLNRIMDFKLLKKFCDLIRQFKMSNFYEKLLASSNILMVVLIKIFFAKSHQFDICLCNNFSLDWIYFLFFVFLFFYFFLLISLWSCQNNEILSIFLAC